MNKIGEGRRLLEQRMRKEGTLRTVSINSLDDKSYLNIATQIIQTSRQKQNASRYYASLNESGMLEYLRN